MEACEGEPRLFRLDDPSTLEFIQMLSRFRLFYGQIHGIVCLFLCIFGILFNILHVIVLTREKMKTSAVNVVMVAIALADIGTMLSYLIYILHFVINGQLSNGCTNLMSKFWMFFLLTHMFLSITLHSTTLWLAVFISFARNMALKGARLNSKWQNPYLAQKISVAIFAMVFIFSLPTLWVHEVVEYQHDVWSPPNTNHCQADAFPDNYTEKIYTLARTPNSHANGCRWFKANLFLTAMIFKIIPCVLLIFLSSSLLIKLRDAEQKRRQLLLNGNSLMDSTKRITSDRTTALLLTILCIFLITEFPQGVLSMLSAIYTGDIHNIVYFLCGDVLDLLSLINSAVNFLFYILMSSRYRHTFCVTILPNIAVRCTNEVDQPNSAPNFLTNTDFPSRIRNGDINMNSLPVMSIGRRRSSPGFRLVREQPIDSTPMMPLSARPSRVF
ncbi:G-PROTEIN-RECEP-F1-2 domain-containing protein [Aphelenchoides bicaudatus]|nr:G-PROTEIN-RECEP-F1-2 domain-containing protein [Aphelenchoides bicaudatus]